MAYEPDGIIYFFEDRFVIDRPGEIDLLRGRLSKREQHAIDEEYEGLISACDMALTEGLKKVLIRGSCITIMSHIMEAVAPDATFQARYTRASTILKEFEKVDYECIDVDSNLANCNLMDME